MTQERLAAAKARLDRLELYPQRVRVEGVRVLTLPWLFRLPYMRRFDGYALWKTILLRRPLAQTSDDLLTHELCHLWQGQHRRWHMLLTYALTRYEANPYEVEARAAVAATQANVVCNTEQWPPGSDLGNCERTRRPRPRVR